MARTKAKTALLSAIAILAIGVAGVFLAHFALRTGSDRRKVLEDGSVLDLNRVVVDSRIKFAHGTELSKLLGDFIPSNGVHLLNFNLKRPTELPIVIEEKNKSWLAVEFKLTGPKLASCPLVSPAFFREFRFVLCGESGIEYVQDLWAEKFKHYSDGYFGYIVASRFPRDSAWLGCRVERRESQAHGGPWKEVANFKFKNPSRAAIQPWVADQTPDTKSSGGLDFVLGEVTVKTIPYMSNDIWNHVVTVPVEVRSNGVVLTNWSAPYGDIQVEDASGNWDMLASHRSLDPRYVWKLETDFEPLAGFSSESQATIRLPATLAPITTNVMNMPVTISWNGQWLDASIPTNDPNHAIRYVTVEDDEGQSAVDGSGSWGKYTFRRGSFMLVDVGHVSTVFTPKKVTVAIVPIVHFTFYTQPRLVKGKVNP
jgi:hypothetical protein